MKIFKHANIITPKEVLFDYCMLVDNGKIREFSKDINSNDAEIIDVGGAYIMAGIIDIHSDMIENLLQPRSTSMMDFQLGLDEAEKQLCCCGITTIYHSVSMYRDGSWDGREIRSAKSVERLSRLIKGKQDGKHLINNKYHLRYELDNVECYDNVLSLMNGGFVDLISIMDHRPYQGQYRDVKIYRRHLPSEGKNLTDLEFEQLLLREKNKPMIEGEKLLNLVKTAKSLQIPVSSHDDDTFECIERNLSLGVDISEFPITFEVAKKAKECGISTLLGAPNILLGGSHSGNLSAEQAIKAGCGDILCSDYYPQALLQSVFYLYKNKVLELHDCANLVSYNPAKALKIDDYTGSIEVGKDADFLIINVDEDICPEISQVYVCGNEAISFGYSREAK